MTPYILTIGLAILLILGLPAAYSIVLSCLLVFAYQRGFLAIPFEMTAHRVVYGLDSFPLLAVPLFLLVGRLMNESGITERLFRFATACVGHLRAGLAHVNILASLIFAGMSGSAVADAAGLGQIEIKAMTDEGYPLDFSCAVTAASATIGPILPPSIPVVLYAILAGVSVNALLIAGFVPGILMAIGLMAFVAVLAKNRDYPTRPRATWREFLSSLLGAFWPLLTPVILVGGIVAGIFTATEAAGVAALYATILFLIFTKGNIRKLVSVFHNTMLDSGAIMFILACARLYSHLVTHSRIPVVLMQQLLALTDSYWLVIFLAVLFLLVVGCFMSTAVAINILTPVMVPIILAVGGDPLHFGIVMIMVLMVGQLTPPFGLVLFAIMGISDIDFQRLVRAVLPFTVPILLVTVLLILFPALCSYLPSLLLR